MVIDSTNLVLIRHGSVKIRKDKLGELVHEPDEPLSDQGQSEGDFISNALFNKGVSEFSYLATSPVIRCGQYAERIAFNIKRAYTIPLFQNEHQAEHFFIHRYADRLLYWGMTVNGLNEEGNPFRRKMEEISSKEVLLERRLRTRDILVRDDLSDIWAPSIKWEGHSKRLWKEEVFSKQKNSENDIHTLQQYQAVLKEVLINFKGGNIALVGHRNAIAAMTVILTEDMLESNIGEAETEFIKDSKNAYEVERGNSIFMTEKEGKISHPEVIASKYESQIPPEGSVITTETASPLQRRL